MPNITLEAFARGGGPPKMVDMPGVTTGAHAAMRVAEAFGIDPLAYPGLTLICQGEVIPADEIIAPWDGKRVRLTLTHVSRLTGG